VNNLAGIQIKIGTYGKQLTGGLCLSLEGAGGCHREARWLPPNRLEDPLWATFTFVPVVDSKDRRFCLTFRRDAGGNAGTPLSFFQFEWPLDTLQRKLEKRLFDGRAVPEVRLLSQ
jgi:hypothetical protein